MRMTASASRGVARLERARRAGGGRTATARAARRRARTRRGTRAGCRRRARMATLEPRADRAASTMIRWNSSLSAIWLDSASSPRRARRGAARSRATSPAPMRARPRGAPRAARSARAPRRGRAGRRRRTRRTTAPRCGSTSTRPSRSSCSSASRTGVRDVPKPLGERLGAQPLAGLQRAVEDRLLEQIPHPRLLRHLAYEITWDAARATLQAALLHAISQRGGAAPAGSSPHAERPAGRPPRAPACAGASLAAPRRGARSPTTACPRRWQGCTRRGPAQRPATRRRSAAPDSPPAAVLASAPAATRATS